MWDLSEGAEGSGGVQVPVFLLLLSLLLGFWVARVQLGQEGAVC